MLIAAGVAAPGCSDDAIAPDRGHKIDDVPGFDFALPCPVADFEPDYLVANKPRDAVPSIDNPVFSSLDEAAWLQDDDRVLGVVFEGQALALPVRILVWHEAVNLSGAAGRIAVTYCPLTVSGISFDLQSRFPAEAQTLGVSGSLHHSNLVLYDRATESLWPQMSGSAFTGPAAGECLDLIPTIDATFSFWKRLYPDTKVLVRPGKPDSWLKYDLEPFGDYWANDEIRFPVRQPLDTRLGAKERVLGILTDDGQKAYPTSAGAVVNDEMKGTPFVVFNRQEEGAAAYKAWVVDGERLIFSPDGFEAGVPMYVDDRTSSKWRFTGECVEGPLAGTVLERMPSYAAFYFAWSSYFPDTAVHSAQAGN
jgi:hypothetical protein